MKKSLLALAALGAMSQLAQAEDSSLTLYGILDAAVGTVQHSLAIDPNHPASVVPGFSTSGFSTAHFDQSASGMFNGGIQDSRWGLKGSERISDDLNAIFTLEQGIDINTGNINNAAAAVANNPKGVYNTASADSALSGQFFNRAAFVGLKSASMGTLTLGRNTNAMFDVVVKYDNVQNAQLFSPLGFSGAIGGGGGVSENTRVDNSIKYTLKVADFNVGALLKLGGVPGVTRTDTGYNLNLGYEAGGFGIQGVYDHFNDALKVVAASSGVVGQIGASAYNTSAFLITAKYSFGEATIKGGFEGITLEKPSDAFTSPISLFGYTVTPAAGVTPTGADPKIHVIWLGGDYNITPAFNLSAGVYDTDLKAYGSTGQSNIYSYSLLADYHLSKRTDVYTGLMYSQYKGALDISTNFPSNYIFAVGIRHKF